MPITPDSNNHDSHLHFHPWPPGRHLVVMGIMAILCGLMYSSATDADFQFDDEPNITECPAIRMQNLDLHSIKRAVFESKARNRVLVSLSFALQHWGAQFLPRLIDNSQRRPDLISWQFRMFNFLIHFFAGFAIYILFLRLLQLPRVEKHLKPHAWLLAVVIGLIWFCSPIQTQAVTYIVQRATSMATLFYALGIICYLEARAATNLNPGRQISYFFLAFVCCACSVFSKEIGITLPMAVIGIEYLLIRSPRSSRNFIVGILLACGLLGAIGIFWFYGRVIERTPQGSRTVKATSVRLAAANFYDDIWGKVMADRVVSRKIGLSPRQRLLTEARVVAMYQSLLVYPAPWRLNLDYDFLGSTDLFTPGEYEHIRQLIPLLLVLTIAAICILLPRRYRLRAFLLLLLGLGLLELCTSAVGLQNPLGISQVWIRPWPVPAIVWHTLLMGFAALYSFRRPLLAYAIYFFYLCNLVESTIISLEVVFEHRLYLPSIGFYLALGILVLEAFYPEHNEDAAASTAADL